MDTTPKIPHLTKVRWLSFSGDILQLDKLTMWQAIALILVECNDDSWQEYVKCIDRIEHIVATELAESHDGEPIKIDPSNLDQLDDRILERTDLAFTAAKDKTALLKDLDRERLECIQHLLQATVLHSLLLSEIDRHIAGEESVLDISDKRNSGKVDGLMLLRRASLIEWKSIPLLKSLGLIGGQRKTNDRPVRLDAFYNYQYMLGALARILARQFPTGLSKGGDTNNVNCSAMSAWIMQNVLDRQDRQRTKFPEKRTCDTIIRDSLRVFDSIANIREPHLRPE